MLAPSIPLSHELVSFYQADVRVRMAGPLAQFRFQESEWKCQAVGDGSSINLRTWGGDLDQLVIEAELAILRRHQPFKEAQ